MLLINKQLGYKVNPYNECVLNKCDHNNYNGKQCTV